MTVILGKTAAVGAGRLADAAGVLELLILADDPFVLYALSSELEALTRRTNVQARLIDDARRWATGESSAHSIVVLDCGVQPTGRRERVADVASAFPGRSIVALVDRPTRNELHELFEAGASAVAARDSTHGRLQEAVNVALSGFLAFCPLTASHVAMPSNSARASNANRAPLSPREAEVVRQLCRGLSNREIGDAMGVVESTVKSHLANVMSKWAARDRLEVTLHALRSGLAGIA